ncbi:hypothetical protein [Corynebacterium senegalense]|uniref:hypothetical protein n=1 Tax=Corynebacterium senegalense TaxID=2080750 RepID=UPI000E1FFC7B|nr:hypothetical protein [Corynebacterium senegalense]
MKKNKAIATTATIFLSGALLAGCGSAGDYKGTWTGEVTSGQGGAASGTATVTVKGGNCEWELTEADGKTNDARCERDGDEFKMADPLTGKDLKYKGTVSGDTLTLTPDGDSAKEIGTMVLTKSSK